MLVTRKITRTLVVVGLLALGGFAAGGSLAEEQDDAEPTPARSFPGYGMDPQARATMRAQRREEQDQLQEQRRQQRLQNQGNAPFMRPPGRMPPPGMGIGGSPVGGSCPSDESCKLEFKVPEGQVVTLTGVWGAASLRCDDVSVSLSAASPVAPWWRCERLVVVEGAGAGYVGFTSPTIVAPR